MRTGLLEQLDTYFDQVDAGQPPITETEVKDRLGAVPVTSSERVTGRRGVLVAIAAALLVLLVGLIPFLIQGDELPPADTVEPVPTTPVTQSTFAPLTTAAPPTTTGTSESAFAPAVSGLGVASGAFSLSSQEYEISDGTFTVWEAELTVDWREVVMSTADEETRQALSFVDFVGTSWDPDSRVARIMNEKGEVEFARFTLEFKGTSGQWVVEVENADTGDPVGSITGSLPGLSEEEILAFLTGWRGRTSWFFVSNGTEEKSATPPWREQFNSWENNQVIALGDTVISFIVDPFIAGPGQFNVWSSTDGVEWVELGPAPWPGDSFILDTLVVRDNQVLASAFGDLDEAAKNRFWSSADGSEWIELTRSDWDDLSGGAPVRDVDVFRGEPPDQAVLDAAEQSRIEEHLAEISQNATVISEDPLIMQLLPGPQPLFDMSGLGQEIEFEPLTPDDPLIQRLAATFYDFIDPLPPPNGPILLIGRISESGDGYELFWPTKSNGYCSGSEFGGGCGGADNLILDGRGETILEDDGQIAVPLHTSVVVLRYNDEVSLWQRPTGGWAIFPWEVDGDETFWIDLYDAQGNLIDSTEP